MKKRTIFIVVLLVIIAAVSFYLFSNGQLFKGNIRLNNQSDTKDAKELVEKEQKKDELKNEEKQEEKEEEEKKEEKPEDDKLDRDYTEKDDEVSADLEEQELLLEETELEELHVGGLEGMWMGEYRDVNGLGIHPNAEVLNSVGFEAENHEDVFVSGGKYRIYHLVGTQEVEQYFVDRDNFSCEVISEEDFFGRYASSLDEKYNPTMTSDGGIPTLHFYDVAYLLFYESGWHHLVLHYEDADGNVLASSGVRTLFFEPAPDPYPTDDALHTGSLLQMRFFENSDLCSNVHNEIL